MFAQDVLPRIVGPVNFVLICPSSVVLAKRRKGVLKEPVVTSCLPHKQPQRHLQISPTFQMVITGTLEFKINATSIVCHAVRNAYM